MRVLVYDANPSFIESVKKRMEITEEFPFRIAFLTKDYSDFKIALKNNRDKLDAILVNEESLPVMPKLSDADLPIFFYTTSDEESSDHSDIGEFIGNFDYGDEETFIKDASRAINDWDIKNLDEEHDKRAEKIEKREEKKVEKTETKEDYIPKEEYNNLKKEVELMRSMIEEMEKKKASVSDNLAENEKKKVKKEGIEAYKKAMKPESINSKIISIYSAKGGTGKSTIAVQIACLLAKTPMRRGFAKVCLIDTDFEFGDVSNLMDIPEHDNEPLDELITLHQRKGRLSEEDVDYFTFIPEGLGDITQNGNFKVIPAPVDFNSSRTIKPDTLDDALSALKDANIFDFIVCDTGNNLNKASLACLLSSDFIYAVYTPNYTTIKCNDSAINALLRIRKELFDDKFRAIINMASDRSGLSAGNIKTAIEGNLGIPVIATIRDNKDVSYYNNYRLPIILQKDEKSFNQDIQPVIRDIIGDYYVLPDIEEQKEPEEEKKKGGFFSNLFKKKKKR